MAGGKTKQAFADEPARLAALRDYDILDTPAEPAFDDITELVANVLDVPIALVSLVDENRQWFKSRVGLSDAEAPRSIAFCDHAIREQTALIVEDASADDRFAKNPLVTDEPRIRFYAGAVLRSATGHPLGTLCALDRVPRTIDDRQQTVLLRLAHQVEQVLELRRRARRLEVGLQKERESQLQKERLAAMLVHDLRNPLSGIAISAVLAQQGGAGDLAACLSDIGQLADDAQGMLSDVLDICLASSGELRARAVSMPASLPVENALRALRRHIAAEEIRCEVDVPNETVVADPALITRLITNLIDNGIRHTPRAGTIRVSARRQRDALVYTVADEGPGVEEAVRERIFEHHIQGDRPGRRGLGLAFCKIAATAHNGTIHCEPNSDKGSRFIVRLPQKAG